MINPAPAMRPASPPLADLLFVNIEVLLANFACVFIDQVARSKLSGLTPLTYQIHTTVIGGDNCGTPAANAEPTACQTKHVATSEYKLQYRAY
jgi:hypothetical protein